MTGASPSNGPARPVELEVGWPERRALVEQLHAVPDLLVLAVTGGGMAAVTDLLNVAGASRTVLEVVVPYAESSLLELTGPLVDGAVSETTAVALARACLARARHLAPGHRPLMGVACTAALVSDRPKKGEHRAHLAVVVDRDGEEILTHRRVVLEKGLRDREGEDRVVADALLALVATAARIASDPAPPA